VDRAEPSLFRVPGRQERLLSYGREDTAG
jgi:hypothetical protein